MIERLRQQLKADEGTVLHAYTDHMGFLTIGTGRLIDPKKGGGITAAEADYLLDNDISRVITEVATALPWTADLGLVRQCVLYAMAFQMGTPGLLKFVSTLRLVRAGDFRGAARQMQRSLWAKQTPERARRLARQMETGEWP